MRWDFPQIDESDFGLFELPVDSWGGKRSRHASTSSHRFQPSAIVIM